MRSNGCLTQAFHSTTHSQASMKRRPIKLMYDSGWIAGFTKGEGLRRFSNFDYDAYSKLLRPILNSQRQGVNIISNHLHDLPPCAIWLARNTSLY